MNKNVAIIGAGELGQAVGKLLTDKNGDIGGAPIFWDADPARAPGQKPLAEIIPAADCIMLCIPSWSVRDAVAAITPFLKPEIPVVAFSKGLDEKSLKTIGELLPEILPRDETSAPVAAHPFAVIGGPMLAREIMEGKPAAGIIASPDKAVAAKLIALLVSDRFKVETSADCFSVSLAGVLKNIYAVALGIADGLGYDGNQKGWLAGRAMEEMAAVAKALGANRDIVAGTAGFADFLATAYSPYSRNREVGEEIVKLGKCDLKGEGLVSLPLLERRLGQERGRLARTPGGGLETPPADPNSFQLLALIREIAIDCKPSRPLLEKFFSS